MLEMRRMTRVAPLLFAGLAGLTWVGAAPLSFEAASVKINRSGLPQAFDNIQPGGRYTATNLALLPLIRFAYARSRRNRDLAPFEVTGGPNWIGSDRFDVNAT